MSAHECTLPIFDSFYVTFHSNFGKNQLSFEVEAEHLGEKLPPPPTRATTKPLMLEVPSCV